MPDRRKEGKERGKDIDSDKRVNGRDDHDRKENKGKGKKRKEKRGNSNGILYNTVL